MVQFNLEGSPVLRPERWFESALRVENQRLPCRIEAARSRAHVNRHQTTRGDRTRHRGRNDILLRFQERLDHPMHGRAACRASWNLWNHIARKLQLRMAAAELDHRLRYLLGRGDSNVGDEAAVQRSWIVEVDDVLGEIGAIAVAQMEVRLVRRRIVYIDERLVLR